MAKTAEQILADIRAEFGPGFSNGIIAILANNGLSDTFAKKDWDEWFFKPADSAFERAHDMRLIVRDESSDSWQLTQLGRDAAAIVQAELVA